MANISNAQVTISAEKVGKQLVEYINAVNKSGAYYLIVDGNPTLDMVDSEGNLNFESSAGGRWNYTNNLHGYFDSDDMWTLGDDAQEAYDKLCKAIIRRGGQVSVDFTDCDPATAWMGSGVAVLEEVDGEVVFSSNWEDEDYTVENFAAMQGEDVFWALGYMYGEEVGEAYEKYLEEWKKDHSGPEFEGMDPAGADEWYDNDYKEQ